jgi:hypothetical protein
LLFVANAHAQVNITFVKSSYADFLFYLLYRSTGSYADLATAVPLTDIPPLDDPSYLPEDSAASGISGYSQLYKLAAGYRAHVVLLDKLTKAEPHYDAFRLYWQQHIAADEDKTAKDWARQNAEWHPIRHLEEMERLRFPFPNLAVDLLALEPSGSSTQKPPTIFTTLSVPSLAWAIGHEGTHMMLGPNGANWKARRNGEAAAQLMAANGGSDYDVEEAMCLLMQAKMSIAYGATAKDFRSSKDLEPSPRRTLLITLENDWEAYTKSDTDAADFLIAETLKTFKEMR